MSVFSLPPPPSIKQTLFFFSPSPFLLWCFCSMRKECLPVLSVCVCVYPPFSFPCYCLLGCFHHQQDRKRRRAKCIFSQLFFSSLPLLSLLFSAASHKSSEMFLAGYFIGASDRWSLSLPLPSPLCQSGWLAGWLVGWLCWLHGCFHRKEERGGGE